MARLSKTVLAELDTTKYLYLRAGDAHRFIPVWVVVVGDRALVRSWNDKPGGWYRAFVRDKRGAIRLQERELAVRGAVVHGARLIDAATEAYGRKYTTKANQPYVRGFATAKRRAATLELLPG